MGQSRIGARLFRLRRKRDVSGVSGVGVVADGVEFDDGTTVLHWRGERSSTTVWSCLDDAIAVHGHEGSTVVEWAEK